MKLLSWNANQGLRRKWTVVEDIAPDIAVIPECADPAVSDYASATSSSDWVGSNPQKGLGVFAFGDYRVTRHSSYSNDFKLFLPIEVTGPKCFNLLAVWNFYYQASGRKDHATLRAINYYEPFLRAQPCIIAGDFNDNVHWDPQRKHVRFQDALDALGGLGFSSAYHTLKNENHGSEQKETLVWRRNRLTTFHVDYCFAAPLDWVRGGSITVGHPDTWLAWSDHCPLIVELPS